MDILCKELIMNNSMRAFWGSIVEDKKNGMNDLIIEDCNYEMAKYIDVKKAIGKLATEVFDIREKNRFSDALKKSKSGKQCTVLGYFQGIDKFFLININRIKENECIVWLRKEITMDENVIKAFYTKGLKINLKDSLGRYMYSSRKLDNHFMSQFSKKGKRIEEIVGGMESEYLQNIQQKIVNQEISRYEGVNFIEDEILYKLIYPLTIDNNIDGTISVFSNITEAYKQENTGFKCDMLEIILDNIPEYISFVDKKNNLIYYNKLFKNEDNKELLIYNLGEYSESIQINEEVIKCNEKVTITRSIKLNNGENRNLEITKCPIKEDEKIIGVLTISRDITENIIARQELEQLRVDLFANLSHELRTPLNVIYSAIQMLEEVNEKKKQLIPVGYFEIVRKNVFRLFKVVNNLIDSNNLDAGGIELYRKNYDIVYLLEMIVDTVNLYVKDYGITIIFDTNVEECVMSLDEDKFYRIILNLLSNSIKFSINKKPILVDLLYLEDRVIIKVKDKGIGIPKEEFAEVFDKMKQIGDRFTKINEGSGMGLYITKGFVELHKGKISLLSEVGVGSEFIIELPIEVNDNQEVQYKDIYIEHCINSMKVEFSDINFGGKNY